MIALHQPETDENRVFPMGVRVQQAKYGLGVFSFAFIPKNNAIGRVRGRIYLDPAYMSDYCIEAGDDMTLEPLAPFCYLNHSCEPNCILMQYVPEDQCDGTEAVGALTNVEEEEADAEEMECYFGDGGAEELGDGLTESGCDDDVEETDEVADPDVKLIEAAHSDEAHGIEIWVETLRDILPGEELTIDYSWPASRAMPCACGSTKCRGWIVDPEELDELVTSQ
jgi:hypothetical protein